MNTSSHNFQHPSRAPVAQSVSFPTNEMKAKDSMYSMPVLCRLEKEKIRIAKDALFEPSEPPSSRRPGDQGPVSLLRKASKAFRQLRDVFEDDLEQQSYVMVFGDRLSLDLELKNGGLRDNRRTNIFKLEAPLA